jgi:putative flippase GtrA
MLPDSVRGGRSLESPSRDDAGLMRLLLRRGQMHSTRVLCYLAIGGATFILYYATAWVVFDLMHLGYALAVTCSCLISNTFHFVYNRNVTFAATNGGFRIQIVRYVAVSALNYIVQLSITSLCYQFFSLQFYVSISLAAASTLITGYLLMNYWVFSQSRVAP